MVSRTLLILCLLLPLAISPWGFDDAYYLKESFLLLAGGGLLIGEATAVWRGQERPAALPVPVLVFLALALLSAWQAINVWLFAFRWGLIVAGLAVFVAVARSAGTPGQARNLLAALSLSGVLATGYGVLQLLHLDPFLAPDSRFVATFGNPHLYAEFAAPLLPVLLCLTLAADRRRGAAAALAGLALVLAGLLWARARGPGLAALVGLGFLLWAFRRPGADLDRTSRKRLRASGVVLAGVTTVMVLTGNVVARKPWTSAPPASRTGTAVTLARPAQVGDVGADFRLAVYRDTLAMIGDRPLTGFGLGNYRIAYPLFGQALGSTFPEAIPVGHVHNDVLEVAVELGLPAAVVFVWMFLGFLRGRDGPAEGSRPDKLWPGLAARAGLVALGVNSLFGFGFYDPATILELWVFAGIAVAPLADSSLTKPPDVLRRMCEGRLRYVGAAVLGCLGLGMAGLGLSSALADALLNRGLARYYSGDYAEAVAPLEKAARLEVGKTEAMVMLGQAHLEVGEPGRALAVVRRAQTLEPYNPQLHYLHGVVLARLGRLEESRQAQKRALALYPLYSLPHVALGNLAELQGDGARARTEYGAALRINPRRAEARDGLALLAVKAGDLDGAIRLWEEGTRLDPGDATTAHNLAVAYGRKGDPERAAAWRARAAALRARSR